MTPYVPSITVDEVIEALNVFLNLFNFGNAIIQGQVNRVPMPASPVFVLTPITQKTIETPTIEWEDRDAIIATPVMMEVQVDIYGDRASDACRSVIGVIRSGITTDYIPDGISILYCDDGTQAVFITAEQQYEQRWILRLMVQYNASVAMPMASANKLSLTSLKGI